MTQLWENSMADHIQGKGDDTPDTSDDEGSKGDSDSKDSGDEAKKADGKSGDDGDSPDSKPDTKPKSDDGDESGGEAKDDDKDDTPTSDSKKTPQGVAGEGDKVSKTQKGISNTATMHSTDQANNPEQSKKPEGAPDSAKLPGPIDPKR
jgi:hypothetical protein